MFGQGTGDTPAVAEQEAPVGVPGESSQEAGTEETEEALASTEDTPLPDRTAIDQPDTKEPTLSPEKAEVARLLAAAEADLKARRLTSPAGHNAWERYQEVLKLDSSNPEALRGMERVIESYLELFGAVLEQEEFEQADIYLGRIRNLHPDLPALMTARKRLEDAKQARTDRLAEQERMRLETLEREVVGEIVFIPGGTFHMGKYEVTVSQFRRFVEATG